MSRENAGANWNCNIENTWISVSQVIDSYSEGLKLDRLLAKIEHTHRKLLYFVNRHNAKSTKIGHNFRKEKNGVIKKCHQ